MEEGWHLEDEQRLLVGEAILEADMHFERHLIMVHLHPLATTGLSDLVRQLIGSHSSFAAPPRETPGSALLWRCCRITQPWNHDCIYINNQPSR